jgi:tetratricopeptide (TPR) repeat protein
MKRKRSGEHQKIDDSHVETSDSESYEKENSSQKSTLGELINSFNSNGINDYKRGFYLLALNSFKHVSLLAPNDFNAYYHRGMCELHLNNPDDAIKNFTQTIRLNPQYAAALLCRGAGYHLLGRFEEAIKDFQTAIQLDPQNIVNYHNCGASYHAYGQYHEAIKILNQAIDLNPQNIKNYNQRAANFCAIGHFNKAIQDYQMAISLSTQHNITLAESVVSYCGRGICYYQQGNFDPALSDFKEAIELTSNYIFPYVWRAWLYEMQGHMEKAKADFKEASRCIANTYQHLAFRGYANLQNKDYAVALQDFNEAIAKNPTHIFSWVNRAQVKFQLNLSQSADDDLKVALQLTKQGISDHFWKAEAHMLLKDWENAIKNYDNALAMRPHFPKALVQRGLAKQNLALFDAAIQDWNKAKQFAPNFPLINKYLEKYEKKSLPFLSHQMSTSSGSYESVIFCAPFYSSGFRK